jgi:hypothetical protein
LLRGEGKTKMGREKEGRRFLVLYCTSKNASKDASSTSGLGRGLLIFCFCARSLAEEGDSLGYFGLAGLGPIWNWAGSLR